ncbi:hypothetical protein EMIT047CA2_250026 [Pseudomonas soli]
MPVAAAAAAGITARSMVRRPVAARVPEPVAAGAMARAAVVAAVAVAPRPRVMAAPVPVAAAVVALAAAARLVAVTAARVVAPHPPRWSPARWSINWVIPCPGSVTA